MKVLSEFLHADIADKLICAKFYSRSKRLFPCSSLISLYIIHVPNEKWEPLSKKIPSFIIIWFEKGNGKRYEDTVRERILPE